MVSSPDVDSNADAAIVLWRSLRSYLKLGIDVRPPAEVTITISNSASTDLQMPRVVFEEIRLRMIGGSSASERQVAPRLDPGQSIAYTERCTEAELPALRFEVSATVSRRDLFKVTNVVVLPEYVRPAVTGYLKGLNRIPVHVAPESLKTIPVPEPSTTVAELRVLTTNFNQMLAAIEDNLRLLRELLRIPLPLEVTTHSKSVSDYLVAQHKSFAKMRDASVSANLEELRSALGVHVDLHTLAQELDRATQRLMNDFQISDQEAGYVP